MKRATIVLNLALFAVAIAIVALFFSVTSDQHRSTAEHSAEEPGQSNQPVSADTERNAPIEVMPGQLENDPRQRPENDSQNPMVTEALPKASTADEATVRKWVREESTQEVQEIYPLLIRDLNLTASETEALLAFLIEDWIATTKTRYSSGIGMDEDERSHRIAAIIGDAKLPQFLALERNLGSYREVQFVASVLEQHAVPMTDRQRDRMLEILIEVNNQELELPGADAERGSIDRLEYQLAQIDERERLMFEQAASALSAEQLQYFYEQYQRDSYRRADSLEAQKRSRADDSAEHLPLHYPGRSIPDPTE